MTTGVASELLLERDERVALLTINRPEARNSMTFEMYEALHDHMERLDADAGIRVVVLRGAGDKAFVSGTDIRQFLSSRRRRTPSPTSRGSSRVLRRIHAMTKPTIAMVQGDAVGGGLFMSLACDLRLVADHARFGAPVARTLGNFRPREPRAPRGHRGPDPGAGAGDDRPARGRPGSEDARARRRGAPATALERRVRELAARLRPTLR